MTTRREAVLNAIPCQQVIRKDGLEKQVTQILELIANEFPQENIMEKSQDNGSHWKWYIEIPFEVPKVLQHAVKDALADKWFDQIHFNDYGSFDNDTTRMSITVLKEDNADD